MVSVFQYPREVGYAMSRWWFVENELVIVCLVATLVAASGGYLSRHFQLESARRRLLTVALAVLNALHAQQMVRFYWSGQLYSHYSRFHRQHHRIYRVER